MTIGFSEATNSIPWALASLYLSVNFALVMLKGKAMMGQINKVNEVTTLTHTYILFDPRFIFQVGFILVE